jgi:hypothetical protein
MSIRSSKSKQTLAVGRGTLTVRCHETVDETGLMHELRDAVDNRGVLRRLEDVVVQRAGDDEEYTELSCLVEYGPVFGCWESDLHRQLEAIVGEWKGVAEFAVFGFHRQELTAAHIDDLATQVGDTRRRLAERKRLEGIVNRLRQS